MLLVLDTCLAACSAALFDLQSRSIVAERHAVMERGHAEALPPMVQGLLQDAQLKAKEITRIAVTVGPGSFTGVRIGLSFARGLAIARSIPLVGLDSLTATAAPLLKQEKRIVVAHHAGASGFVYTASFGENASAARLAIPSDIQIDTIDIVIGTAAGLFGGARLSAQHDLPLAHLFAKFAAELTPSPHPPEPLYLREADAKPQRDSKRAVENVDIVTTVATDTLAHIHAQCFDHPWTEQSISEMLDVPGTQALMAATTLGPQGFVLVRAIAGEAEILTVATLPHVRQRGLGRALINASAGLLAKQGIGLLHLEVAADNDAAIALYEKTGFVRSGLRKGYYARNDGKVDAILMQKRLGA